MIPDTFKYKSQQLPTSSFAEMFNGTFNNSYQQLLGLSSADMFPYSLNGPSQQIPGRSPSEMDPVTFNYSAPEHREQTSAEIFSVNSNNRSQPLPGPSSAEMIPGTFNNTSEQLPGSSSAEMFHGTFNNTRLNSLQDHHLQRCFHDVFDHSSQQLPGELYDQFFHGTFNNQSRTLPMSSSFEMIFGTFNNQSQLLSRQPSVEMLPVINNNPSQHLSGPSSTVRFPGTFNDQSEEVPGQSTTYPCERRGKLASLVSGHDSLSADFRKHSFRSPNSSKADRFTLLKIMESLCRTHKTKGRMYDAFWRTVTRNFNEQTKALKNVYQVKNMYKNMKRQAKKYQVQLRSEGKALETDEMLEFLLKMLEEASQRALVTMQQATDIGDQGADPSIPGPSTVTPASLALNSHQASRGINATPVSINEEIFTGPPSSLRSSGQEMTQPSSSKFEWPSTNVSDAQGCTVSKNSSEGDDGQIVHGMSTSTGDPESTATADTQSKCRSESCQPRRLS